MFCKNLINHCKKLLHLLLKTRRVKELSKESTPWKESPTRFSRMFLHCTLQWLHQNILICTPIILQIKVKNIYKMNFSVTIFLKKLYQLHYSNSIKLSKYHTNSNAVAIRWQYWYALLKLYLNIYSARVLSPTFNIISWN